MLCRAFVVKLRALRETRLIRELEQDWTFYQKEDAEESACAPKTVLCMAFHAGWFDGRVGAEHNAAHANPDVSFLAAGNKWVEAIEHAYDEGYSAGKWKFIVSPLLQHVDRAT